MADRIDISAQVRVQDQATGPLKGIESAIKGIGDTARSVGNTLRNLSAAAPFGGLQGQIRNIGSALGGVGQAAGRLLTGPIGRIAGALGIAGIGATIASLKDYADTVSRLGRVARQTGLSVENIQALRFAAGDADAADLAMSRLTRTLGNFVKGGKGMKDVNYLFKQMGITQEEIRAGNYDQVLMKIARGFERNVDPAARAAAGQALFGRGWERIVAALSQGPQALQELAAELSRTTGITAASIQPAMDFRNAWRLLGAEAQGLRNDIAGALLPAFTPLMEGMRGWIATNREWIKSSITRAVEALIPAVKGLWEGINTVVGAMGGWQTVAIALGAYLASDLIGAVAKLGLELLKLPVAALFDPLTLALGAIGAAGLAAYKNWDNFGPWLTTQLSNITGVSEQAWRQVYQGFERAYNNIVKAWKTGGLVGAAVAAVREVSNNWGAIMGWMEANFPALTATAREAWTGISQWATTSLQNIKRAWETGGLAAAMTVAWEQIKSGAQGAWQFIRDLDWKAIGDFAANAFRASWQTLRDIGTWLRDRFNEVDWATVGTNISNALRTGIHALFDVGTWIRARILEVNWSEVGISIGNAIRGALTALVDFSQWLTTLDWNRVGQDIGTFIGNALGTQIQGTDLVNSVITAFAKIGEAGLQIGLALAEGIIRGLTQSLLGERGVRALDYASGAFKTVGENVEAAGKAVGRFTGLERIGQAMGWGDYSPEDWSSAAEAVQAAGQGQVIPFPARPAAAAGPPAPLAPAGAVPAVAQPSLLQQAREAVPVRLDGEINNRLRVDMSPDLRAMLQEQRTSINLLRNQVEIGQSMGPAMGEAA